MGSEKEINQKKQSVMYVWMKSPLFTKFKMYVKLGKYNNEYVENNSIRKLVQISRSLGISHLSHYLKS